MRTEYHGTADAHIRAVYSLMGSNTRYRRGGNGAIRLQGFMHSGDLENVSLLLPVWWTLVFIANAIDTRR